jgi:hypothetical protein
VKGAEVSADWGERAGKKNDDAEKMRNVIVGEKQRDTQSRWAVGNQKRPVCPDVAFYSAVDGHLKLSTCNLMEHFN